MDRRIAAGAASALLFVLLLAAGHAAPAGPAASPIVDVAHVDGIIGPAMSRYVRRALGMAQQSGAQALILEMDTPGGLMKSMDDITKALINSPVPSVVYVTPSGARAASAGVFITYAATIAAMAPTTHLGAAHPVGISSTGGSGGIDKTEMAKITNDASAEIRGFALRHGRNAAWAERAVRQSVSITDQEALRIHVIDLIASNRADLLAKLNDRIVHTASGMHRLTTRDAAVVDVRMDLTESLLQLLSDPNVGFILMMIAIYGIIFELNNPGAVFPGVIGGLALILALTSFAAVEVDVAGLLLIGFAVLLFIADIKVPSHGVLTTGGVISFVLGSLLLTQNQAPFLRISLTLILVSAAVTALFFMFAVGAGIRAQRRTVKTGREAMVGAIGVVRRDLDPTGTVFVEGELWNADSVDGVINAGDSVQVVRARGLHLEVRKADGATLQEAVK
jgi:membrane-bound serine protease (ClpP class)